MTTHQILVSRDPSRVSRSEPLVELPTLRRLGSSHDTPTATRSSSHRIVLIAEPDWSLADNLSEQVSARGIVPVVADDGEAAVRLLARFGAPLLAIVNATLPPTNGFDLIRAMREHAAARTTPVIVMARRPAQRARAYAHKVELGIEAIATPSIPPRQLDAILERLARRDATQTIVNDELGRPDPDLAKVLAAVARSLGVTTVVASYRRADYRVEAHHGCGGERLLEDPELSIHELDGDRHRPRVIASAYSDPRYARHSLVVSGLLGSYVAVPLRTWQGAVRGTLGVAAPGEWLGTPMVVAALERIAGDISSYLERLADFHDLAPVLESAAGASAGAGAPAW